MKSSSSLAVLQMLMRVAAMERSWMSRWANSAAIYCVSRIYCSFTKSYSIPSIINDDMIN
jgi:hypothetical protein